MYIEPTHTFYTKGVQHTARSAYLVLASSKEKENNLEILYACVRQVAQVQVGQFMMGYANIAGTWVSLSGSCGQDGLPLDYDQLTEAQQLSMTRVPPYLAASYWLDTPPHPETFQKIAALCAKMKSEHRVQS